LVFVDGLTPASELAAQQIAHRGAERGHTPKLIFRSVISYLQPAMKANRTQVIGALLLAGLVMLGLLIRYWKFSG
jgi:hypothetical protein